MKFVLRVIKPMNRCSDSVTGSPSFTISTLKDADGKYVAKCDSLPELPSVTRESEVEAIRDLRLIVERHIVSGGRP